MGRRRVPLGALSRKMDSQSAKFGADVGVVRRVVMPDARQIGGILGGHLRLQQFHLGPEQAILICPKAVFPLDCYQAPAVHNSPGRRLLTDPRAL